MKLFPLLSGLGLLCVLFTVTVAFPADTKDRAQTLVRTKKLPRQEELVVVTPIPTSAPTAKVVSSRPPPPPPTTTVAGVSVTTLKALPSTSTVPPTTLGVVTGSVPPLGDHVEVIKSEPSTVKTFIEGESLSSPSPGDVDHLVLGVSASSSKKPSVQVTTLAPPRPVNPPVSPTVAPVQVSTTTVRPGEEEESSEEDIDENEVPEAGPPPSPQPESESEDPQKEQNSQSPEEDQEEEEEEEEEDEEARSVSIRDDDNAMIVEALEGRDDNISPKLDAFIPGYITEQGEILVPIDTLEEGFRYSIIPDKKMKQGRLDISPRQGDLDEEEDESAEDAVTSSEEDDDVVPVRLSSFNVIYKKKKNKDEEVEEDEEETGGDETPPEPTGNSGESKETSGNIVQIKTVSQGENYVPRPPLQAIPATRPTGEDDEDELKRLLYGGGGTARLRLYEMDHHDDDVDIEPYYYPYPMQQKQYYTHAPPSLHKPINLPYLNYYE